jgi:hypothetical protein
MEQPILVGVRAEKLLRGHQAVGVCSQKPQLVTGHLVVRRQEGKAKSCTARSLLCGLSHMLGDYALRILFIQVLQTLSGPLASFL